MKSSFDLRAPSRKGQRREHLVCQFIIRSELAIGFHPAQEFL
jgi:hypothetical protein